MQKVVRSIVYIVVFCKRKKTFDKDIKTVLEYNLCEPNLILFSFSPYQSLSYRKTIQYTLQFD